jgi:serine/threonine-protein kinase RsbT
MDLPAKTINLLRDYDIVLARQSAREMARNLGFGLTDQTRIATAVSEVARRVLDHRGKASVSLSVVMVDAKQGLQFTCLGGDWPEEPAEVVVEEVLGGVERLMDDWEFRPAAAGGAAVVMHKWL